MNIRTSVVDSVWEKQVFHYIFPPYFVLQNSFSAVRFRFSSHDLHKIDILRIASTALYSKNSFEILRKIVFLSHRFLILLTQFSSFAHVFVNLFVENLALPDAFMKLNF